MDLVILGHGQNRQVTLEKRPGAIPHLDQEPPMINVSGVISENDLVI
jgi:hypothetical protein